MSFSSHTLGFFHACPKLKKARAARARQDPPLARAQQRRPRPRRIMADGKEQLGDLIEICLQQLDATAGKRVSLMGPFVPVGRKRRESCRVGVHHCLGGDANLPNVEQLFDALLEEAGETLEELTLVQLDLVTLPENVGHFSALQRLNLHRNPLETLPGSMAGLLNLNMLLISEANLSTPPREVWRCAERDLARKVREYFQGGSAGLVKSALKGV
jgi:hypothetical protein